MNESMIGETFPQQLGDELKKLEDEAEAFVRLMASHIKAIDDHLHGLEAMSESAIRRCNAAMMVVHQSDYNIGRVTEHILAKLSPAHEADELRKPWIDRALERQVQAGRACSNAKQSMVTIAEWSVNSISLNEHGVSKN